MLAFRTRGRAALFVVLLTAMLMTACSSDKGPEGALKEFLAGWMKGDVTGVPVILPNGETVQANAINEELKALSGTLYEIKPSLTVSKVEEKDGLATGQVFVSQPLPGDLKWEYPTTVKLSKGKDAWQVIWEPTVVHPQLSRGERLETRRIASARASLLAGNGEELVKPRPVVVVGVWPARITDAKDKFVADLVAALAPVFALSDTAGLTARVSDPANADQFIEVVTLRRELYDKVRPQLQALNGTTFREQELMLAESSAFASALLGAVRPVTKEIMDANPGVYEVNDLVGQGGLQQKYDLQLRGTAGVKVVSARKAPDGTTQEAVLHTIEPKAGTPVKTTLDSAVQRAAEAALAKHPNNSSLVAIRVSDGAILAAANHQVGYNMAFNAQVPPGSTFKAVSALALLDSGKVTPGQIVACPREFTVSGRTIHNAGMFSLTNPQFTEDFYRSCNTAFASLAPQLGADGLAKAGTMVGLGQPWDVGIDVWSGKVSQGTDPVEQAAASFGQGTTVVSPLAMAGVAAGIARGQWKQPRLVLDPAPASPAPDGPALKPSTVDPLRQMMRLVVSAPSGTASVLAHHGALHGKTGTAEYVTGDTSKTHAWFIGWSGDIAFAVFVEQGGSPAATALPITDAFLKAL